MDTAKKSKASGTTGGLLKLAAQIMLVIFLLNVIVVLTGVVFVVGQRGVGIEGLLPLLAGGVADLFMLSLWSMVQLVLPLLLALLLEITVHELGHVLGGKLAGFRFVLLIIGPLRVSGEGNGLRFGRTEAGDPQLGAALSVPTDNHNLRWRTAIAVAGGPLGSLALGLTSAATLALFSDILGPLKDLVHLSMWVSLISSFINLLPIKVGGTLSDGARLKMLLVGGVASERYCLITALSGSSRMGLRPREWNETWMKRISELSDGSLDDAAASHIAFYWLLDKGDIGGGERTLERLLAAIIAVPAPLHHVLYMEAAFFYAYYHRDLDKARSFLEKVSSKEGGRHYHMQARAEAAVLALEGQQETSRTKAAAGLAHMEREQIRGPGWELDYEWLQALASPSLAV